MSKFLFDFIQSFSKREKAYFKRHVSIHADNKSQNYLKLYDAIEKMKVYRKSDLESVFEGTTIEKYLSSEVNYLKNKLLTSLFNFHLNKSPKNKIEKGIFFTELLLEKGFRTEAMKKLKFSKKIAYEQEAFMAILRLIEIEEKILFKEIIIGYKEILKKLKEERKAITKLIQNMNELHLFRSEIRELQYSTPFVTDDFKNHPVLSKSPYLKTNKFCLSKTAYEHWCYAQIFRFYLTRDYKKALNASIKQIQILEENQNIFKPSENLGAIGNYIYMAALAKNEIHFKKALLKLERAFKEKDIDKDYAMFIKMTRVSEFAYRTNDTKLMRKNLNNAIAFKIDNNFKSEEAQSSYLQLCIIRNAIALKEYEVAATHLNNWYQDGITNSMLVVSRIFSMIIHFELNWNQLLESESPLLSKLRKKFPYHNDLIQAFLNFFKKVILQQVNITNSSFKILQKDLASISKNEMANFGFEVFDFYRWSIER